MSPVEIQTLTPFTLSLSLLPPSSPAPLSLPSSIPSCTAQRHTSGVGCPPRGGAWAQRRAEAPSVARGGSASGGPCGGTWRWHEQGPRQWHTADGAAAAVGGTRRPRSAAGRGRGGRRAAAATQVGSAEPVMGSAGSFFFWFFCPTNRGRHATTSVNASFTEAFAQRQLCLPASVNVFQLPLKKLL